MSGLGFRFWGLGLGGFNADLSMCHGPLGLLLWLQGVRSILTADP